MSINHDPATNGGLENEGQEFMTPKTREDNLRKVIQNEALIEAVPSFEAFDPACVEKKGGSIYYGTGIATPRAASIGLPFDVLGMILTAEKMRVAGGFEKVIHFIADTHAKTNDWANPDDIDALADRTERTVHEVVSNLGLTSFEVVRSSSFDQTPEYNELLDNYRELPVHEYVQREVADIEYLRQAFDLRLKLGWIVQASETEMRTDERIFDQTHAQCHPGEMSFVYGKPGRTFDTSNPKKSPYVTEPGERRLMLNPSVNVADIIASEPDPQLGGAKKHLNAIIRLYEDLYGSLGKIGHDGVSFESKLQTILNHCFGNAKEEVITSKDATSSSSSSASAVQSASEMQDQFTNAANATDLDREQLSKRIAELDLTPEQKKLMISILEASKIRIPETGLIEKLALAEKEGRRLRVKMGFDPTSPDLHLGHAVSMVQLAKLQQMGHLPVIIIGDYTGRIGDPTGRNEARPLASPEELVANAESYISQLSKVLDIDDIEVHRNSDWLAEMSMEDVIRLLAQMSVGEVISRDDFRKRLDAGTRIGLHEIIYPLMQGTDSVKVNADIEVGGVDQLYAFQAGRTLQKNKDLPEQALLMFPLLVGLDGEKKMSKSLGNYVGLTDEPSDMFGKLMSIPDHLIEDYFRLATLLPEDVIVSNLGRIEEDPISVKTTLAKAIVEQYHGVDAADKAEDHFTNTFRNKTKIEYVPTVVDNPANIVELLKQLGVAKSNGDARRLIQGGGVSVNGERVDSTELNGPFIGSQVKVGKRRFFEVTDS